MTLQFIGKDPESPDDGSPAVWVDDETGDSVLQGWTVQDAETASQVGSVPAGEVVLRMPARMSSTLRCAVGG